MNKKVHNCWRVRISQGQSHRKDPLSWDYHQGSALHIRGDCFKVHLASREGRAFREGGAGGLWGRSLAAGFTPGP